MAEIRQKMRGSTANLDTYIGSEGQVLVDLSRMDLRVYDGITQGGFRIPNSTYMYSKAESDARHLQITDAASTYLSIANAAATYLTLTAAAATYVAQTTQVIAGDGLQNGGALSGNVTLDVDSTVLRNSGNQTIIGYRFGIDNGASQAEFRIGQASDQWRLAYQPSSNDMLFLHYDGVATSEQLRLDKNGSHKLKGTLELTTAPGSTTLHAVRGDRAITAGDGLSGGGDLSADRALAVDSTVMRNNAAQTLVGSLFKVKATATDTIARLSLEGEGSEVWAFRHESADHRFAMGYFDGLVYNEYMSISAAGLVTLASQATGTGHAVRADRTLTAGDGLSGGGDMTANRTFSVDSTVVRTNAGANQEIDSTLGATRFEAYNTGVAATPALSVGDDAGGVKGGMFWHAGVSQMRFTVDGTPYLGYSTTKVEALNGAVFTGSGANLTSLNAANVSTGILADARLSSNVALRDVVNTFTANQQAPRLIATINGGGTSADPALKIDDGSNPVAGIFTNHTDSELRLTYNGAITLKTSASGVKAASNNWLAEVGEQTSDSETDLPIGSVIGVRIDSGTTPARNAVVTPKIFTGGTSAYVDNGAGTALSGTWRSRGRTGDDNGVEFILAQRVA